MGAKKTYLHCAIAVIIGIVLMLCIPVGNGLTADGVHMLGILVPTIYLWIAVGTDWVSLLAIIALVMTGVMSNDTNFYTSVYAGSMGNFIIITVIACMALSAVLTQTGVIEKIATWFITRDFVKGRPYAFVFMFLLSNLVVGTFMEATAVAIMYIDLAKSSLEKLGYKKGDSFYTMVMSGLYWTNSIVSCGSPISHVLPLFAIGIASSTLGVNISFAQWLMIGIPFEIMAFLLMMLVFRIFWKPDTEKFQNYDLEAEKAASKPLSTQGKVTVVIFLLVVFFWLFPQFGKSIAPGMVTYLNNIGACVPPVLGLTAVFVIHIDGKPIAKFADTMKTIPMGMLIFTACVSVLGTAINLESTGISTWISNLLTPALSGLPTAAVIILVILIAAIITQFMSDTVTLYLMCAVGLMILANSSINLPAFAMVICFASTMGLLTPAAAVPSLLFFGPEHITMKDEAKYCGIFLVLDFLIIAFILWPLASAIIKC